MRRFIPKGAEINNYTAKDIKRLETWMNRVTCAGFSVANLPYISQLNYLVIYGRQLNLYFASPLPLYIFN